MTVVENGMLGLKIRRPRGGLIHPLLEDFDGGGLVDEGFLLFGVFSCFMQLCGGADGAVGFVDPMQRDLRVECLQLLGKTSGFLCGLAFSAIEVAGETDDDGFDLALLDQRTDARERFLLVSVDGFHGVRHDADRVGRGDADAGVAVIDAEGGMWGKIAQVI